MGDMSFFSCTESRENSSASHLMLQKSRYPSMGLVTPLDDDLLEGKAEFFNFASSAKSSWAHRKRLIMFVE